MKKRVFSYLRPYKTATIVALFAKLLEAVLEILLPTMMAIVINEGVLQNDGDILKRYSIWMVLMLFCGFGASVFCQYLAAKTAQSFGSDLRNDLFKHITTLDYKQLDAFGKSTLSNRLTNDTQQVQLAVNMGIRLLSRTPFVMFGAIIMSFYLEVPLAAILISVIPAIAIALLLLVAKTTPLYALYQKKLDKLTTLLYEQLKGIRVIRAFLQERKERTRFESSITELQHIIKKIARLSSLLNPLTGLFLQVAICLILWTGGIRVHAGSLQLGTLVAFVNYATQIVLVLAVISNLIILFTKANASRERIQEIMDTKPILQYGDRTEIADSPIIFDLQNVSFGYYEHTNILQDINLTIAKGETIGILGGTGSGKTTLLRILMRHYDIKHGKLSFYGEPLSAYQKETLQETTAYVQQEAMFLPTTIKDNLAMGYKDASDEDMKQALQQSNALGFVEETKDGLMTFVERHGNNFSGGQKQRLCLARALLKPARILLIDDGMKALDVKTEANVRHNLQELPYDAKILVSQRITSLLDCDRICFMEHQTITHIGTHEELYDTCNSYRELCESQGIERSGQHAIWKPSKAAIS